MMQNGMECRKCLDFSLSLQAHPLFLVNAPAKVLGGNGRLDVLTPLASIEVPVVTATEEWLSYYGAHLLKVTDYLHQPWACPCALSYIPQTLVLACPGHMCLDSNRHL